MTVATRACRAVLPLVAALATSCTMPVASDAFRQRVLEPRTFAASPDRCLEATRTALSDQGYEIKSEDGDEIVTGRRTFTVNARSTPIVASAANPEQRFQMEQADQLWVRVEGADEECVVRISRMRLWNGAEEMMEIQGMGADWARKHIVEALYRDVDANL